MRIGRTKDAKNRGRKKDIRHGVETTRGNVLVLKVVQLRSSVF
jgi:hypothetical protein